MENENISRSTIHELAMKCIFEYLFYEAYKSDYVKKSLEEIVEDVMEVKFNDCDVFFRAIVFETIKNKNEYISIIEPKLVKWKFERLCLTDKAILLLATSEIINNRVPKAVGIDVAVDLAHKYCDDKSYKYINKVLDRIGNENAN